MFTGLIEGVGGLLAREAGQAGARLRVATGTLPFADAQVGESIAVNGACLTVAALHEDGFEADVSAETLVMTTLGALAPGRALNLERALRLGDRLGGHMVGGHVDGVGRLESSAREGETRRWRISMPDALARYLASKGSITVDGVSLTINALDPAGFSVMLVPHTLAHTALGAVVAGDAVNLEVDMLARYVERLLHGPPTGRVQ